MIRIYAARLPGELPWRHSQYEVRAPICGDMFDYGDGLRALWDTPATIVNVEHDMEFSDELVRQLVECEHPLCAHAYRMHQDRDYYAHGHYRGDGLTPAGVEWISEGEEWAAYSALGFVKITPEAQRYPLSENCPWQWLEAEVNAAVAHPDVRWHIHWPEIEHYHRRAA